MKTGKELDQEINEALSGSSGKSRGSYPDDLIPGDIVVRRDIKGKAKYSVSHTGKSGGFVQVYTRKIGSGGGGIITFDRSQLKTSG